jgi:hypothetical protein
MDPLIMQFSPSSCHDIHLRPKYDPCYYVLTRPQLVPFPYLDGPSSSPIQTTGKTIGLYILIVTSVNDIREDKRFLNV